MYGGEFLKSIITLQWKISDNLNTNAEITYYIGVRYNEQNIMILETEVIYDKTLEEQTYDLSSIFNDSHKGKDFTIFLYGKYGSPTPGGVPSWVNGNPPNLDYTGGNEVIATYNFTDSIIEFISVGEN